MTDIPPHSLTDVPLDSSADVSHREDADSRENEQNDTTLSSNSSPSQITYPPQQPQLDQSTSADTEAGAESAVENKSKVSPTFKEFRKEFYSARPGMFERALEEIKRDCYNANLDGENLLGAWMLLEVDHWDTETEKIVLLYDESLLTVRYDFVPMKIYKAKKLFLRDVDTVRHGNFAYPKYSLCNLLSDFRRRKCEGVRILWNKGVEPTFLERWDNSSRSMPWQTFTYHPLMDNQTPKFDVIDFMDKTVTAIKAAHERRETGIVLNVCNEPLKQDIYLGVISQVHNDSFLGMSKERGGLSF